MSAEGEFSNWWQMMLGIVGLGGLGGGKAMLDLHKKVAQHSTEIGALQEQRSGDYEKLERAHDAVITLASDVGHIKRDICKIHDGIDDIKKAVENNGKLYLARRRQRIEDTGGESDE